MSPIQHKKELRADGLGTQKMPVPHTVVLERHSDANSVDMRLQSVPLARDVYKTNGY